MGVLNGLAKLSYTGHYYLVSYHGNMKNIVITFIFLINTISGHLWRQTVIEITKKYFNKSDILIIISKKPKQAESARKVLTKDDSIPLLSYFSNNWAVQVGNERYQPPNSIIFPPKKTKQTIIFLYDWVVLEADEFSSEILRWKSNHAWSGYASILIIIDGSNIKNIAQKVLEEIWNKIKVMSAVVLSYSQEGSELYSWSPYNENCKGHVNYLGPWVIGSKNNPCLFIAPQKWNLKKCKIFAAVTPMPPYVYFNNDGDYDGFEVVMFKTLSEIFNFTYSFTSAPPGQSAWVSFIDGVPAGLTGRLYRHEADFAFHGVRATLERFIVVDFLDPCFGGDFVWAAPLPEKVAHWKLFFLAFEKYMWIGTLFSVIISGILIKLIGEISVLESSLLTLAVTLNNSIPYVSTGHLMRIFLCSYFLFILNLTAAYQSGLFQLLWTGIQLPPLKSAMEAATKGYRFGIAPSAAREIKLGAPDLYNEITSKHLVGWSENYMSALKRAASQKRELALLSDILIIYETQKRFTSSKGKKYLSILQERFGDYSSVFYIEKDHPLKSEVQKYLRWLTETGWPKFYINDILWRTKSILDPSLEYLDDDDGIDQSISLEQLLGAFVILFSLLLLAALAFLVEVISKLINVKNKKIVSKSHVWLPFYN